MGSHGKTVPAQEVLDHLRRLVQQLRTAGIGAGRGPRLSGAQLLVLQQLREHGSASIGELAQRTLTHQSSVSVVVARLVRGRWVRRDASAKDARVVRISLTPAGERLAERAPPLPHTALREAVQSLPPADQRRLAALLGRVASRMSLPSGPPSMFFEEKR